MPPARQFNFAPIAVHRADKTRITLIGNERICHWGFAADKPFGSLAAQLFNERKGLLPMPIERFQRADGGGREPGQRVYVQQLADFVQRDRLHGFQIVGHRAVLAAINPVMAQ